MLLPQELRLAGVVLVSAVAGAMNSIAGGGTLLTFPALVGLGIPPIVANATSTVALWPGSASSMWGYRNELDGSRRWALGFAVPSLLGGIVGAWLLIRTPPSRFAAIVPWLVLSATALFMLQPPIMRWANRRRERNVAGETIATVQTTDNARTSGFPSTGTLAGQLVLGVYGGYFGAGAGILMLALLGFVGLSNIHRMNGLKNWGGMCMNFVAAAMFAVSGLVDWPVALAMAVASMIGGYIGSRTAQRVPQRYIRYAVVFIGLAGGAWLMASRRA